MPLDITTLTPNIYVGGGIFHKENAEELVRMGVTHVLDMQGEYDDGPLFEGTSVKTLWVPFHDVLSQPTQEIMDMCACFINKAIKNPKNSIFLHCAAGVHRGPMSALLALCISGMDINSAERVILSRRLIATFPKVYFDAVKQYVDKNPKLILFKR